MFENIIITINSLEKLSINEARKEILDSFIQFIQQKIDSKQEIRLNFICTHNSRRSHLTQIWAQTMAFHFNIPNVYCYSGGTEATAMFYKVSEILQKQGFKINPLSDIINPVYAVKYAENQHPIICFSKEYFHDFNPKSDFAAIMTCNDADLNCPVVYGAEKRIPIKYDDPKAYDNTKLMNEKYEERSLQIASEMFYVFSRVK